MNSLVSSASKIVVGSLIILVLAGFAGVRMSGGFRTGSAPPTPIAIIFQPTSPTISDGFVVGAQVATMAITMSDGSTFNGSLGFSPPVTTGCAQNGNSNGLFSTGLSPPTLITARNGTPADDGLHATTVTATQNGSTICAVVTVSITSSGIGVACDIGPNFTGAIPAGAQLAGFTHCAANYDFTSTGNFNYAGHTYNFSQIATWLGGCGATNWLWYNTGYNSAPHNATPCARYNIISDGGTNVLDMTYTAPDATAGAEMTWMTTTNAAGISAPGTYFPQGLYTEATWRSTPATFTAYTDSHDILSYFGWNNEPTAQTNGLIEWDVVEVFADGGSVSGCVDWFSGNTNTICPLNPALITDIGGGQTFYTSYHTTGQLATSDGTTFMEKCHYVDGIQEFYLGHTPGPCTGPKTPFGGSIAFTQRDYYGIGVGNQNDSTLLVPAAQMDMLIKSITFWACPNWQTQQCNTATVIP